MLNEEERFIVETADRIFRDLADPRDINSMVGDEWVAPLWSQLVETGLTTAWGAEEYGGSGASLRAGFELIKLSGRFALAAPLAETLLAARLCSDASVVIPAGRMTVAPAHPDDTITIDTAGVLHGRARRVPWAAEVDFIVITASREGAWYVAVVPTSDLAMESRRSLSGDPVADLVFDGIRPTVVSEPIEGDARAKLLLMGCVVRALQTAGALERMLELCVEYADERVAFERKISRFQAVQHNIAILACEVAAAAVAAGSAADAIANAGGVDWNDDGLFLEAVSAKVRCAEAASRGSAIAHQVHGAIGVTEEHVLHRYTLRALSWRDDFGNDTLWAMTLGDRIAERGASALWPLIAAQ